MTKPEGLESDEAATRRVIDTAGNLQRFVGVPSGWIAGRLVMGKNQYPTIANMDDYALYYRSTPWYRFGEYSDPDAKVGRVVFGNKFTKSQWEYVEATVRIGSAEQVMARYTRGLGITDGESRLLDTGAVRTLADTLTVLANEYYDGYAFAGSGDGLQVASREAVLGSAAFLGARDFNLDP